MAHIHGAAANTTSPPHAAMGHATSHGASAAGTLSAHGHRAMGHITQHAGTVAGMAAAANSPAGRGLMSILTRHPLVVFGLGIAAGYYAHKYRKEIIESATRLSEKGKDFVLHQRENLEDLVAECKECGDEAAPESEQG